MNEQIQPPQGAPLFNPWTPAFIADPYSFYHRLRATDPMHLTPLGYYVASRHADVAAILRDKRFGKDFMRRAVLMLKEPVYLSMSHWILQLDPPDHGRLRNLVVRAFTARRVEDMRPRIQQIVDELIDRLEPQGHMDLIADFASRLPVTVICDMLGIPEEDRQVFFTSSHARFGRLLDMAPLSRAELDQQNSYYLAMAEYFGRLFELRRREPEDDLTTYLVQAEENDRLTNEELTANVILLFAAGHETTVNLIGNGLLALHRNPDQLRLLKNDPSLMANAIEELLRYDASVQVTSRTALEYVDEIGGISLEKGRSVICLLGSANRDPAVYSDPDRLDVTRPDVRPLSFGGGIHHCVGAQLARLEGEIAIATLLGRLPDLQLDDVDHPDWQQTFVLRGLNKLPASW
ncbi:MAG TPA: cytochrome P450 [Xanthobacteraceae bacterium]|nr:cytochrome P450 [Xanthobacteraceae bacterium]